MITVPTKLKKSTQTSTRGGKGTPPALHETRQNLSKPPSGVSVPIQVKTTPEIRKAFRAYAVENDLRLNELFEAMFEYYTKHHG